ncbi:amidase [Roseibium algae]|uniref:Amidase n=1 Tax=Roseibium algae TaxID=3123038 RepID=A0ABU8TJM5_9HYPH
MTDLWRLPLSVISELLTSGKVTSSEVLAQSRDRILKLNPALNALITHNPEAEIQAAASDARRSKGKCIGPLDGIPIAIKDNILTKDLKTTWGSPVYEDYQPSVDEIAVERLKTAGAVIIGKTNVPEFTLEGFTDNTLFGPTRNPYDIDVTPGGSSGGSVAGVAAGLFPAALGTDGGGSIRRPAGYTGLVGLKPSIGRIPRTSALPQVLVDMEVIGPLTRTVSDAALILSALEGPHPEDPRSALTVEPDRNLSLDTPPAPLRVLYVERMGDAPLDPVIASTCRAFADRLASLEHKVDNGPLPLDISALNDAWPLIGKCGLAFMARTVGAAFEKASPKYLAMAEEGRAVEGGQLFAVFDLIATLRRQAATVFQSYDVIVSPTAAAMPWAIGMDFPPEIDGQPVGPRGHAVYTGWVNAIGHPAIAIPTDSDSDGMPIGVQMIGGFNRDWLLLRLARQVEMAYPFADSWPSIAEGR